MDDASNRVFPEHAPQQVPVAQVAPDEGSPAHGIRVTRRQVVENDGGDPFRDKTLAVWLPIKPAPPVTSTCMCTPSSRTRRQPPNDPAECATRCNVRDAPGRPELRHLCRGNTRWFGPALGHRNGRPPAELPPGN